MALTLIRFINCGIPPPPDSQMTWRFYFVFLGRVACHAMSRDSGVLCEIFKSRDLSLTEIFYFEKKNGGYST